MRQFFEIISLKGKAEYASNSKVQHKNVQEWFKMDIIQFI